MWPVETHEKRLPAPEWHNRAPHANISAPGHLSGDLPQQRIVPRVAINQQLFIQSDLAGSQCRIYGEIHVDREPAILHRLSLLRRLFRATELLQCVRELHQQGGHRLAGA